MEKISPKLTFVTIDYLRSLNRVFTLSVYVEMYCVIN